jgi:FKBP-type peptidyl-prolyl cis-trans isomerase FklB
MTLKLLTAAALLALAPLAQAADSKFTTDKQRLSYAIGFQIGSQLKGDGLDLDTSALSQAIMDVLAGTDPQLTPDEMQAAVDKYRDQRMAQHQAAAQKNLEASSKFLEENKKNKDIVTLDSGLQYKVLTKGTGKKPSPTDSVTVNYRGTLTNGVEFDSSYSSGKPVTFPVNRVIQGWQDVLPMMEEGAKWQVFIPPQLAYGENGSGGTIGPNEALIFEIELVKVN